MRLRTLFHEKVWTETGVRKSVFPFGNFDESLLGAVILQFAVLVKPRVSYPNKITQNASEQIQTETVVRNTALICGGFEAFAMKYFARSVSDTSHVEPDFSRNTFVTSVLQAYLTATVWEALRLLIVVLQGFKFGTSPLCLSKPLL